MFSQETTGLYAWGQGSLAQSRTDELIQFTPIVLLAIAGLFLLARRMDLLGLGDDASRLAGADPRLARVGAQAGVEVPTGAVTTVFGAVFLVILAMRMSDAGLSVAGDALARLRSRRFFLTVLLGLLILLTGLLVAGSSWAMPNSCSVISSIGSPASQETVSAQFWGPVCRGSWRRFSPVRHWLWPAPSSKPCPATRWRNQASSASQAVAVWLRSSSSTAVPTAGSWVVTGSALGGAALSALLVFGLAFQGGLQQNKLVLIGIGISAGLAAAITVLLVTTDTVQPGQGTQLAVGFHLCRNFASVLPPLLALVLALPVLAGIRGDLDLIAGDDDSPRVLGIRLSGSRLGVVVSPWGHGSQVLCLTASATSPASATNRPFIAIRAARIGSPVPSITAERMRCDQSLGPMGFRHEGPAVNLCVRRVTGAENRLGLWVGEVPARA